MYSGRRHVDLAVAHLARQAGVGLRRERHGHHLGELLDRLEDALRPHRAVHPDDVRAHGLRAAGRRPRARCRSGSCRRCRPSSGRRPAGRRATAHRARYAAPELVHVAEGLQDEAVHPAGEQPVAPAGAKAALRLGRPTSRRTARSGCPAGRSRRPPRPGPRPPPAPARPRRALIRSVSSARPYCASLTGLAPKVLVSRISAPACTYSRWMSRTRSGCLSDQLVVADVEEHAPAVEHRAHRPVEDVDAAVGQQISRVASSRERRGSESGESV